MSKLTDLMLDGYSYLDAPFRYSGGDKASVSGRFVDISWKRMSYPGGSVRHAMLHCMGTFEGHLIVRADGTADIENTMGHVIGKMDSVDRYALAALLISEHQD